MGIPRLTPTSDVCFPSSPWPVFFLSEPHSTVDSRCPLLPSLSKLCSIFNLSSYYLLSRAWAPSGPLWVLPWPILLSHHSPTWSDSDFSKFSLPQPSACLHLSRLPFLITALLVAPPPPHPVTTLGGVSQLAPLFFLKCCVPWDPFKVPIPSCLFSGFHYTPLMSTSLTPAQTCPQVLDVSPQHPNSEFPR